MTARLPKKSNAKIKASNPAEKPIGNTITIKIEDFLKFSGDYKFLESVLNFIPEPISIKNSKGEYLAINKAMEELLGYGREQVIGKSILLSSQQKYLEEVLKADTAALKKGISSTFETRYQKPDGKLLQLVISKHRINLSNNNEPGILTIATDITRMKRVEDLLEIQYTIDFLATLNEGLEKTFENILKHIFKLYWVDCGGIYLYFKNEKILRLISHKGLSNQFIRQATSYNENSPQMKMLLNHTNFFIETHELKTNTSSFAKEEGIRFFAILPLINQKTGEVVGALNLASKRFDKISDQDKKGIESISTRIVNLILYAKSQEDLKEAQLTLEKKVEEQTNELNTKIKELITKENEIRKSEQKYLKLQENLPVGIFSSTPQGNIIYVNKTVRKMFGYDSMDEITKISVIDLYKYKEERNEILQTIITKGKLPETEIQLVRKDKSTFWGLVQINVVFDNKGVPVQFDGILEDMSEIKQSKIKLEEANKKIKAINKNLEKKIQEALTRQEEQNSLLIQKSKLESLGELSAGIAHEINQPLGVMALTFENLKLKINAQKITPQYIETKYKSIEDNIKRIREIIDHIRIFAREQESFVLDKVNVNKVVRKALSMIGAQYRNRNINIRLDLKEDIGFTVGSNLKLEQVILNLLSNSKYALEEKGIYESETEFSKEILIKTDTSKDKIILLIEDNGNGIKAKYLMKIFDPFFTTKPEGFGTGLGLSIVYGLVKEMRGEVLVNSREKEYTKFKITFPRFPEND